MSTSDAIWSRYNGRDFYKLNNFKALGAAETRVRVSGRLAVWALQRLTAHRRGDGLVRICGVGETRSTDC